MIVLTDDEEGETRRVEAAQGEGGEDGEDGGEEGGWKRRLPDTATARIRPGRVEEYRGYTRRYGRPRGGVNAIKRASIRPSRRTSLISQSLLGLCSSRVLLLLPPVLPVDLASLPLVNPEAGADGSVRWVLLRDKRGYPELKICARICGNVGEISITPGKRYASDVLNLQIHAYHRVM